MNAKQKVVLLLGALAIAAMSVYPPWVQTRQAWDEVQEHDRPGPYAFVLAPPWDYRTSYRVDFARLMVQCLAVAAVSGVTMVLLHRRRGG